MGCHVVFDILSSNTKQKTKNNKTMKRLSETLKEMGVEFTFPIEIKNEDGRETYFENSHGFWSKREYDANGYETRYENSNGYWSRSEMEKGRHIYFETCEGYWERYEYTDDGVVTYFENSDGDRSGTPRSAKTCEGKVVEIDGVKYELKTINN